MAQRAAVSLGQWSCDASTCTHYKCTVGPGVVGAFSTLLVSEGGSFCTGCQKLGSGSVIHYLND